MYMPLAYVCLKHRHRSSFQSQMTANVSQTRQDALNLVDRGMVRIRRSQSRRTIGRLMQRKLGQSLNFSGVFVADALDELAESGVDQPTVGAMAERLGIEQSRASRMVANAIGAGLVKRHASQLDGRRAHLELTKDGRKALAAVRRFRIAFFSAIMADWSDQECSVFAELLTRFTDSLQDPGARADVSVQGQTRKPSIEIKPISKGG
jgi:DNA-binding MarR family transcriptional regulator